MNGEASQAIVDDAVVIMPIGGHDNSGVHLRGKNMNGKATLVIKGANPILQVGRRFRPQSGDTASSTQYVDFEVPEGGWADAPIRTDPSNAYTFGAEALYFSRVDPTKGKVIDCNLVHPENAPSFIVKTLSGTTIDVI